MYVALTECYYRLANKEGLIESVVNSRLSPKELSRVCEEWDRGVEGMEAHQRGVLNGYFTYCVCVQCMNVCTNI